MEEKNSFRAFCIRAWLGDTPAGRVSGLVTNAYVMFTYPSSAFEYLDSESAVYGDESLAYLDRVLPQAVMEISEMEAQKMSNEDIDKAFEKADSSRKMIAEMAENDVSFVEHNIVFLDDIFVNSDCRQHGVFSKMMEVFEIWFGKDCSGAAYIYPVKPDDEGDLEDDDENETEGLKRNRMVAEKYRWTLADDFMPSATERNSYALKLPEFVMNIAKEGEEFRKYVPHE